MPIPGKYFADFPDFLASNHNASYKVFAFPQLLFETLEPVMPPPPPPPPSIRE